MALHRLLGMEIGVPKPAALDDFYQAIGLTGGAGAWGGAEHPDQIRVVEAPYRQLIRMRVACEGEEDLAAFAEAEGEAAEAGQAPTYGSENRFRYPIYKLYCANEDRVGSPPAQWNKKRENYAGKYGYRK